MSYMIKIICCDCGKVLGEKKGGTGPGMISHTYCDKCLATIKAQLKQLYGPNYRRIKQ